VAYRGAQLGHSPAAVRRRLAGDRTLADDLAAAFLAAPATTWVA
jgi:hypothetical protein